MQLTIRQERFAAVYAISGVAAAAARVAGYSERSARQIGFENLTKPYIKAAIAAKEAELAQKIEIDRDTVVAGIFGAMADARSRGDAGTVIRAWCEVARLTGLDKPETVKRVISAGGEALRSKFEALSDEELLAIAEGRG
jgi:phage terminase small subunit